MEERWLAWLLVVEVEVVGLREAQGWEEEEEEEEVTFGRVERGRKPSRPRRAKRERTAVDIKGDPSGGVERCG